MNLTLTDNSISRQHINFRELFKSKDSIKPMRNLIPMMHQLDNVISRKVNYNTKEHTHGRVLKFDRQFEKYLDEVEKVTHIPISSEQRDLLKDSIDNNEFTRLSADETKHHRKQFSKDRSHMIAEWESHTHQKWNIYKEDKIYNDKIIRRKGDKWDAHELILNSWGSPHSWWNITPAPHPEHQNTIHGKGSMANKIFGI